MIGLLSYTRVFYLPSNIQDISIYIVLILLIIFSLSGLGIYIYLGWRDKEYVKLVREYSRWFHNIQSINSHTTFIDVNEEHKYSFDLSSKAQFDRFDFDKAFQNVVAEDKDSFNEWLRITTLNAKENERYQSQIEQAYEKTPEKEIPIHRVNKKLWDTIEKKMCSVAILQPALAVVVVLKAEYTSPAGVNYYDDYRFYDRDDVCAMLKRVRELEEFQNSKVYQRRKMSPKLRYEVLKRDGFRCVLCGRGREDGVKLEVDHIIPVSKGGRTTMSNLRTLCMDCNRGKGDHYEEDEEYF